MVLENMKKTLQRIAALLGLRKKPEPYVPPPQLEGERAYFDFLRDIKACRIAGFKPLKIKQSTLELIYRDVFSFHDPKSREEFFRIVLQYDLYYENIFIDREFEE